MATGSGKTVVMSMLIAWHTLNKVANPQNRLFSDAFLVVAPGITIRDRLRVLLPNNPENYYRKLDLLPMELMSELEKAKIVITNFHTFKLRELRNTSKVKIPRVLVSDNTLKGELPTYRNLWSLIHDHLPKKGRGTKEESKAVVEPKLPKELEGALKSLYINYKKSYQQRAENKEAQIRGLTPPVFIVVCNNTNVSKLVFDYISGWDTGKQYPDGKPVLAPGNLPLFSNVQDRNWTAQPNTILVDSEQLESGKGISADFKKMTAREIEEFKAEHRTCFPGQADRRKLTAGGAEYRYFFYFSTIHLKTIKPPSVELKNRREGKDLPSLLKRG